MITLLRFDRSHLDGAIRLCEAEGWPSFPADPERAVRVLTAPGVTTVVAVEDGTVLGFAQLFSDGELQAFLALLAVDREHRGAGIGRSLVTEALRRSGQASAASSCCSSAGVSPALRSRSSPRSRSSASA